MYNDETPTLEAPQPDPVIDYFKRNYDMQKKVIELLETVLKHLIANEVNDEHQ